MTSASFYDSGRRVGRGWQLEPRFGTAAFGSFDAKGRLSEDVVLMYEDFALKGRFEDAVLAEEATPAKVTKVAFTEGGLIMNVEVQEDHNANKVGEYSCLMKNYSALIKLISSLSKTQS